MLNLRGNNMVTFVPVGVGNSLQDSIVRLSPSTREHNLRSGAPQERCDPGSGVLHRFFGGHGHGYACWKDCRSGAECRAVSLQLPRGPRV